MKNTIRVATVILGAAALALCVLVAATPEDELGVLVTVAQNADDCLEDCPTCEDDGVEYYCSWNKALQRCEALISSTCF